MLNIDITNDELIALYAAIGYSICKNIYKEQNSNIKDASMTIAEKIDKLMDERGLLD